MRASACRVLALAGALAALVATAAHAAAPADVVTIQAIRGTAGKTALVPVFVRDVDYTPLGRDQLVGRKIQGLTLRVVAEPPVAVTALAFSRTGILATPTPLFEAVRPYANTLTWFAVFRESTLLPFDPWLAAPGNRVGTLKVTLAANLPVGTVVSLRLDPEQTILANQAGSRTETKAGGTLALVDGAVAIPGTVRVSVLDGVAAEPGADTAKVQVARTGSTGQALAVRYAVAGSAAAGKDYATLSGTLVIPAGAAAATLTVKALDDALPEGNETVTIQLRGDPRYVVGTPAAVTVTIKDND